ncbi:hemolysin [Clostridium botulinum]|nr:hemolysin [Clostridium botulinum]NFE66621.1 hemolysin [Clostridium sporogenes]MBO0538462.1 hemolysin [Clostridium botulinum]MBO0550537.1 hemolysin [Clostridium botulinum]MBO0557947.1 hemolysin [Clostridium botulinum]
MWNLHCKFNRWKIKDDNEENNPTRDASYKKVNIEDIPFL